MNNIIIETLSRKLNISIIIICLFILFPTHTTAQQLQRGKVWVSGGWGRALTPIFNENEKESDMTKTTSLNILMWDSVLRYWLREAHD